MRGALKTTVLVPGIFMKRLVVHLRQGWKKSETMVEHLTGCSARTVVQLAIWYLQEGAHSSDCERAETAGAMEPDIRANKEWKGDDSTCKRRRLDHSPPLFSLNPYTLLLSWSHTVTCTHRHTCTAPTTCSCIVRNALPLWFPLLRIAGRRVVVRPHALWRYPALEDCML